MNYAEQFFGAQLSASKNKTEYIDRSDLEAFGDCPQQGQLRKAHEGEFETTESLPVSAKIVHKIAEEAIKANRYSLQEAADYFAEELPKALGRSDLQPEVLLAGKNLANQLKRYDSNRVLLCEEQITRSILPEMDERGELLITTAPDLCLATGKADTMLVLDYKAGFLERTSAEARDSFQTTTISWVLKGKFPEINTIHFFYLQTRTNSVAYAKIQFDKIVGPNDLTLEMAMQQRLLTAAMTYRSGLDEAWPSQKKCAICPVLQWCVLTKEVCKEIDKDPKTYIDNTLVMAEAVKRREKAIADVVKDGRVLYGSCGHYDTLPLKKSAVRVSYKEDKTEVKECRKTKKKTKKK